MKETLLKQLDALLVEEADDGAALSIAARQTQGAKISSDLLSTERDLSWFVWAGLSQGLPVWFGDISPAATLGAQYRQAACQACRGMLSEGGCGDRDALLGLSKTRVPVTANPDTDH
jgi:hypothetical protein